MKTRYSHTDCNHANTKTARAACRRARLTDATDRVVNHTFVFVRKARAEGYSNTIKEITFFEIAQEYGIPEFDLTLAKKMARERAAQMNETDLLDPEVRLLKEVK